MTSPDVTEEEIAPPTPDDLWEVAHAAWHALDDSEERVDEVVITISDRDALYAALLKIGGEDIHDVPKPSVMIESLQAQLAEARAERDDARAISVERKTLIECMERDLMLALGRETAAEAEVTRLSALVGGMPDIETVSAKVHEAWMDAKKAGGVASRKLESGEELMVPYDALSEQAKELDRGTVRTVFVAIAALAAAPLPVTQDSEMSSGALAGTDRSPGAARSAPAVLTDGIVLRFERVEEGEWVGWICTSPTVRGLVVSGQTFEEIGRKCDWTIPEFLKQAVCQP